MPVALGCRSLGLMVVSRSQILEEIRSCAKENSGRAVGRERFEFLTGIRETDWLGRYWVRWSDAVIEAGFEPNQMQTAYDDADVLRQLVELTRDLGHVPTVAEMRMRRRQNPDFPSHGRIERLGSRARRIALMAELCEQDQRYCEVLAIVGSVSEDESHSGDDEEHTAEVSRSQDAFVYLLKSRRHYKIGRTGHLGRRAYEIDLQLPEKAKLVHSIRTDDPVGIERYWHQRFADRRANGEWFLLSQLDVAAFRRRRFM